MNELSLPQAEDLAIMTGHALKEASDVVLLRRALLALQSSRR